MLGMDLTILNVAVPQLREALDATTAQVQWIVDGYALMLGGSVLAVGAVTDRWGRRRCFVLGVAVCGASSVGGALAGEPWQVITARCGMGAGAALLMPATLGALHHMFPEPELRRRAIAVWAAVGGLGGLSGPVIGGWLVEHASWRAAFWINLPLTVVIIAAACLVVPESRAHRSAAFDAVGALLSTAGLLALVWAIIEGPHRGWTSGPVMTGFALAGLVLAAFLAWERHVPAPMLPLHLLARPGIGVAAAALALMSFALFGALFVLTLYLQGVLGYSPVEAGVRTLPLPAGLAVGAAAAVAVQRRLGVRTTVVAGLLVVAASFGVWATTTAQSGYGHCALFQAIAGMGAGLVAAAGTESVMESVPTEQAGLGSAINDATRQVGSALGVAVQGSLLTAVFTSRFVETPAVTAAVPAVADAARHSLLSVPDQAGLLPPAQRVAVLSAARDAFIDALTLTAMTAAAVVLLTAAAAARWLAPRTAPLPPPRTRPAPLPEAGTPLSD
ncbi:MFS transporter [Streptomyces viridochromogenes]|uniref:MFS transporter n=2 Tax=Streptomyces viridochromogenes TaxID=1938 RepID=A0A0J8C5M2_STRVR|nr:MFS transporter [Streptomyces viridochromogenes]KOG11897.1 MFS transporter [Streptomyces viridochromogenes]KOG24096.1 MFS transporter [Streptomyces viridochromogenes]